MGKSCSWQVNSPYRATLDERAFHIQWNPALRTLVNTDTWVQLDLTRPQSSPYQKLATPNKGDKRDDWGRVSGLDIIWFNSLCIKNKPN